MCWDGREDGLMSTYRFVCTIVLDASNCVYLLVHFELLDADAPFYAAGTSSSSSSSSRMQAKALEPPSRAPAWTQTGEVPLSVATVRPWLAYPSVAHTHSLSHYPFSQPPSRAPTWMWTGEVPLSVAIVRPWAELREAPTWTRTGEVPLSVATIRLWAELREAPTWMRTGEVPLSVATVRSWAELKEASTFLYYM